MYIEKTLCGYDRDGAQFARSGLFLILMQRPMNWENWGKQAPSGATEIRAVVRKVTLRACGPWMMGHARIKGRTVTLSGAYGGDGLPVTVPSEIFTEGSPLPPQLFEKWSTGGGHNCAGTEAPAMRKWALENLRALYRGARKASSEAPAKTP